MLTVEELMAEIRSVQLRMLSERRAIVRSELNTALIALQGELILVLLMERATDQRESA
jgi:hypothetical protein